MGDFNFGFGPGSGSGGDPDDLAGKVPLFAELQRLLSGNGGPVNWDLARQLAISAVAATHRSVTGGEKIAATDAVRLADLWLDDVTDFPSGVTSIQAWSQVDWIEKSIATWASVCDPVAARVVASMSESLPPEVAAQAGPMAPMMSQLGGLMFGAQLGQGLAALAGEVVSGTDVGIPLAPSGTAVLLSANLEKLASEVGVGLDDVRLYISLREAAHQRLFAHVPWLHQQLIETVDAYARGISIDPQAISTALAEVDPSNPASLQSALSNGMFEPQTTPAQKMALRRLETLLALIEGWVDVVVARASQDRMQTAAALGEAIRRRRASGGPAEQTFATLVGLELRPRRLQEAASLWASMTDRHSVAERDGLWGHPDLLPSADDLDQPDEFAARFGTISEDERSVFEELIGSVTAEGDSQPTNPATGGTDDPATPPAEPGAIDSSTSEPTHDPSSDDGTDGDSPASK